MTNLELFAKYREIVRQAIAAKQRGNLPKFARLHGEASALLKQVEANGGLSVDESYGLMGD